MLNNNLLLTFILFIFFIKKTSSEAKVNQNDTNALIPKSKTTKKPATFCNDFWKNYSLTSIVSIDIEATSTYHDIGVLKNGSFYLVKCSLDENSKVNGFIIDYFTKLGTLKFSKTTKVNLNAIENGPIRMAIDHKGFIYIYFGSNIWNGNQMSKRSFLFKLNKFGEVMIAKNGSMTADGYLSYSKQDKFLYLKSDDRLLAFETEGLHISFNRKLSFPMYATQFLSGRPGMLYAFDGLSLMRYDVVRDELMVKRVKDTPYPRYSASATLVSQCILVAFSVENLNATQSKIALNVIQLNKKQIFDMDITHYNFVNPAMLMRATADNRIYMFDIFYNKLFIFYY